MIIDLKNILDCLDAVGVEEVVIEPSEDSTGTLVRGADRKRDIVVFDTVEGIILTEYPIGIQSVKGLLSRLSLFDDDATIELEDDGEMVMNIKIKKGRKKASYKCAAAEHLSVPKFVPGDLQVEEDKSIVLTKEYVSHLSHAIQSMSFTGSNEQSLSVKVDSHNAVISIYDGEDDSFTDELKNVGLESCDKSSWGVKPFQRVMKCSIEGKDQTAFTVNEHGVAVFTVGLIDVIISPFA